MFNRVEPIAQCKLTIEEQTLILLSRKGNVSQISYLSYVWYGEYLNEDIWMECKFWKIKTEICQPKSLMLEVAKHSHRVFTKTIFCSVHNS